MSKEEAFVGGFVQCLSSFAYDKARDTLEKEKEACKGNPHAPHQWPSILNALTLLLGAEKSYTSLHFLSQKWFGRKDGRLAYTQLASDLRRVDEQGTKQQQQQLLQQASSSSESMLASLAHVCGQLVEYANARSRMMDFFEQLHACGSSRIDGKSDLLTILGDIIPVTSKKFQHPLLAPLKSTLCTELDILKRLLQADEDMAHCRFLPSLLHLNSAHGKLVMTWSLVNPQKDTWKLSFAGIKQVSVPPLYEWLKKYKDALLSKFSIYFYETLSKQVPPAEYIKTLSKANADYYSKILAFHKKTEAALTALLFDSNGTEYYGSGYRCPNRPAAILTGTSSYPVIFSHPSIQDSPARELASRHIAAVIMLMGRRDRELNAGGDRAVYEFDSNVQSTYFLSRIDPRVTMVVIYDSKKSDKECKSIHSHIVDTVSLLRCARLYASLRPS